MGNDERLERQIAIRLSEDDLRRLDKLAERIPIASRNAIARTALRIGLAAIEENPARALAGPSKSEATARKKKP